MSAIAIRQRSYDGGIHIEEFVRDPISNIHIVGWAIMIKEAGFRLAEHESVRWEYPYFGRNWEFT